MRHAESKSTVDQQHWLPTRWLSTLCVCCGVLVAFVACSSEAQSSIPTPDLEILAPTATGVTARIEVVVVVATATAAPTPAPTEQATPGSSPAPPTAAAQDEDNDGAADTGASSQVTPTALSNQQLINRGEEIYARDCSSCHGPDGAGTGSYPALNQSGLLQSDDPGAAIQLVLYGRGAMPAFEDTLSNQQIAAVLSYGRNAWQNNSSVVRVAQVRQVRQRGNQATDGQSGDGGQTATSTAATVTPATTVPAASPAASLTGTVEATATAATNVPAAITATTTPEAATDVVAPSATGAPETPSTETSASASQPTVVLTWTPARRVTPLLPAAAPSTPVPAATVTLTVTTTATTSVSITPASSPSPASSPASGARTTGAEAAKGEEELISRGTTIYTEQCASCHRSDGEGSSTYPALNGSDILTADDPTAAIEIVLYGAGTMPAFQDVLSAAEIAAVLSHGRTAWDNNASIVTEAQVEEVEAANNE